MILIRTVVPTAYPVSLVEVKSHLNISHADSDAKLDQLIAAAVQNLDGVDGILDRALCRQGWTLKMSSFGTEQERSLRGRLGCDYRSGMVELPLPPCVSVDVVTYLDEDDIVQMVDPTSYRLIDCGTQRSILVPTSGSSWPSHASEPDAVRIAFTAGYAPGEVPETIKQAILLAVSHWNEHREEFDAAELRELPHGAHALLLNHRHVVV